MRSFLLGRAALGLALVSVMAVSVPAAAAPSQGAPPPARPIIVPASPAELQARVAGRSDRAPLGPVARSTSSALSASASVVGPNAPSSSWTVLGPQPVLNEYWSGNRPASGRVSSIAVDPTNPNSVYLAAAGGGVWKSNDHGTTWSPLTDQLSSLASGALAIDPSNSSIVYYGTGEQHFSADSLYGDGLFKSFDFGATWTKTAPRSAVGSYIARVLVKPSSSIVHLASDRGYLRSTDGGANWTVMLNPSWATDLVLSPAAPSTLFAAIYGSGVYKSTDDGTSWTKLGLGLPSSGFQRINLAISASSPGVVYASFVNPSGNLFGMYKSVDGGSSWVQLASTPNYLCGQGWYDNTVLVDPTNPNIVYAGGVFPYGGGCNNGVIKTTNGGVTWQDITRGTDGTQVHPDQQILTAGSDGTIWLGDDGGVFHTSTGGLSWVDDNSSLGTALLYTVALHPFDPTFLLSGTQDNGSVQYTGTPGWPQVIGGDGGPAAVEWADPNIYYTTYVHLNPVYKWYAGASMGTVTGPWTNDRSSWANGPFVVDPNIANTLLVGTYRVWRSMNSGGSWAAISPDLTGGGGFLLAIAVASGNSSLMYTGSSDGRVYVTTDGGTTWNLRNAGLPPSGAFGSIVLDPNDPNQLTAYLCVDGPAGAGRVYQTLDGANTWSDISGNLPAGLRGLSLALDSNNAVLYLGTDSGVYSSADGGTTWGRETDIPSLEVDSLAFDTVNSLIVAATHGRGMWEGSPVVPTMRLRPR